MCGRFTLRTRLNLLVEQFAAETQLSLAEWAPRYNIAPTQKSLVLRMHDGKRTIDALKWGLIPSWAKDPKIASSLLNARGETIATKPAFRAAFKRRRCAVIADGYYEWLKEGKVRKPLLYEIGGGQPFLFAGLWETWQDVETFTIVTTEANELAAQVHDRMPVILSKDDATVWLNPDSQADVLLPLIDQFPAADMTVRPVNPIVNNARNECPECINSL